MNFTIHPSANGQCLIVELLCTRVVLAFEMGVTDQIQSLRNVRMIFAKPFRANLERLLVLRQRQVRPPLKSPGISDVGP